MKACQKANSLGAFILALVLVFSMYACGDSGNSGGSDDRGGTGYVAPELTWIKYESNPVIDYPFSGGTFDSSGVKNPWVIYENGTYKMWYAGRDADSSADANYTIGYATSSDGVNWTPSSTSPVLDRGPSDSFDNWHAYMPVVMHDGSTYKMWYTGDAYAENYLGYATSPDGKNWTKYDGSHSGGSILDWQAEGLNRYTRVKTVIKEGSTYKMWYWEGRTIKNSIGYATSSNGIDWNIYGDVLLLGASGEFDDNRVYNPVVFKNQTSYIMLYAGNDGTYERIGVAYSEDGINWTKSDYNPVIDIGAAGSWDDGCIRPDSVILDGDTIKLWYEGRMDGQGHNRVGYAESSCQ